MGKPQELAVQLYSLKVQALDDPVAMLRSVSGLGYGVVETAGDYGWSLDQWRALLEENQLRLGGAHLLMEKLEEDLPRWADWNAQLGNVHLVVPVPPDGEGSARYVSCAERLNRAAEQARSHGCHLSYHNHQWEFEPLEDGRVGMDILLSETDPELVKFQVDTAWAMAGGGNVLSFVRKNRGRISCLHAKEYGLANQDEPTMGEGDVPFPEILQMAVEDGWEITVEHEPGETAPVELKASAVYLKEQLQSLLS